MRNLIILLVASVCFFACRSHSSDNTALIHNWGLKTLSDTTFTVPDGFINLQMDAKGAVNGYGGCNSFSGTYSVKGKQLFFSNLASTLLWCDYGNLETKFLNALQQTNNYSITNYTLSLYHDATLLATLSSVN